MNEPGWLSQRQADVPPGDEWLGDDERRALARLTVARRRSAWRLGRWTAKAAAAARLGVAPERLETLACADGAPEVWLDGRRAPISVSLSHRADLALAVVALLPSVVGCDLEVVEPRSDAFVREWLAPTERELVRATPEPRRAVVLNLIWTAKEAAAKVWREGLRLDVRRALVSLDATPSHNAGWLPLQVRWDRDSLITAGWGRWEPGWVMSVVGQPAPGVPRPLALPGSA
jgi:4'-phosphopantetheinyl transferase